jgi:hypothetical protein
VLEDAVLRSARDAKLTPSVFIPKDQVRMIQTLTTAATGV